MTDRDDRLCSSAGHGHYRDHRIHRRRRGKYAGVTYVEVLDRVELPGGGGRSEAWVLAHPAGAHDVSAEEHDPVRLDATTSQGVYEGVDVIVVQTAIAVPRGDWFVVSCPDPHRPRSGDDSCSLLHPADQGFPVGPTQVVGHNGIAVPADRHPT